MKHVANKVFIKYISHGNNLAKEILNNALKLLAG